MRDMTSINTELMDIQRVMGAYQLDIGEKKEKIQKLKSALSELDTIKDDLFEQKDLCEKPELTEETFYGRNADHVESHQDDMRSRYNAIPRYQISDAEEEIENKIETLEDDITDLESSVSKLETEQKQVKKEKEKVESKS